jgi:hypothetical protein
VPPSSGGKGKLGPWSVRSFSRTGHLLSTDPTQYNWYLSPLPEDGDIYIWA